MILLHLVLCRRPVVALRTGGVATPYPSTRVIHNLPAFNRPCPPALSLRTTSCSCDAEVGAGQASEVGTAAVRSRALQAGVCCFLSVGTCPPPRVRARTDAPAASQPHGARSLVSASQPGAAAGGGGVRRGAGDAAGPARAEVWLAIYCIIYI